MIDSIAKTEKGIVKAISNKNNSVLIEVNGNEEWYNVLDNVKMNYISKGKCEFKFNETEEGKNNDIFFLSMEESQNKGQPKSTSGNQDEMMAKMSALKAASILLEGTAKEEMMEKRAEKNLNFLKTGKFE